ncbi:cupin domain-containing protein [Flavobacteriaceae bacterium TP-CH-4]|uniref:Cupin domain-containing protein n=1 Tax=Pelagihabitans pacificus TaxID=2696054 RepID=A0A967ATU1_9FLAO|nr:cupin domain-containing protein [Pelagihabitans pacificus]NHF59889.1 cupin domain-containing protein [Pelagihabitans pacificus]
MEQVKKIIQTLNLQPHPEGGYFRETYRSKGTISENNLGTGYKGSRNYCTCIYFLLTSEIFSAFHRIAQDEIWHFYEGAPIQLHTLSPDGKHIEYVIGKDLTKGQVPQLVVPGGHWFAARILEPEAYALVGCTVSPGFSFDDFVLPARERLIGQFPEHRELIMAFTRK